MLQTYNLVSRANGKKNGSDALRQTEIMVNYFVIKQNSKRRREMFILHTLAPYGFVAFMKLKNL